MSLRRTGWGPPRGRRGSLLTPEKRVQSPKGALRTGWEATGRPRPFNDEKKTVKLGPSGLSFRWACGEDHLFLLQSILLKLDLLKKMKIATLSAACQTLHISISALSQTRGPQLLLQRLKIGTHNLAATEASVFGTVPRAPARPRLGVSSQEIRAASHSWETGDY